MTDRFLPPDVGLRDEPCYLTIPEAAVALGISRWSMWRITRRGLIPSYSFPFGGFRILAADLERFREKCRRERVASLPTRPAKPSREELRRAADDFAARTRRQALVVLGRTR